jgi:hypothetical protein
MSLLGERLSARMLRPYCRMPPARTHGRMERVLGTRNDLWVSAIINLAIAALYYWGMPRQILIFERHAPLIVVGALETVVIASARLGRHVASQVVGYGLVIAQLVFLIWAGSGLVHALAVARIPMSGAAILLAGAYVWLANVLVFAVWYWRFDGGGPHLRQTDDECEHVSFLFPQMELSQELQCKLRQEHWKPGLIDYLFLAFNTSTALSPADTAVIGRWAKLTSMIQAAISLTVVVVVLGRSVNVM